MHYRDFGYSASVGSGFTRILSAGAAESRVIKVYCLCDGESADLFLLPWWSDWVRVWVDGWMGACVRACVRAYVCACVRERNDALYRL